MILVNDTGNHLSDADDMEPFAKTAGPNNAGIPFVQIKADIAQRRLTRCSARNRSKKIQTGYRRETCNRGVLRSSISSALWA